MNQAVEKDVALSKFCTFRLGGMAKELVRIQSEQELERLFDEMPSETKWFVLGGGSNVVFPDTDSDVRIIKIEIPGMELQKTVTGAHLSIGAGESWDAVVAYAVENNLSGIEALSMIPGTTGATPIQNVGAYGTEIKDVLVSLRAFDIANKKFVELTNTECAFGYRDSIFKNTAKGKYIITRVTLGLSSDPAKIPQYPGVVEYFTEHGITEPSLGDIRNAIMVIRGRKLPDPKEIASVGSFFKNPFVPKEHGMVLKEKYPTLAVFPIDEERVKVGAGSLIDTLGYKGKRIGNFSCYKGNAMVIVNEGGGTRAELQDFLNIIISEVEKTYGIRLEPEPELIEF